MLIRMYEIQFQVAGNFVSIIDTTTFDFFIFFFFASFFILPAIFVITSFNLIYSIFSIIFIFLLTVVLLFLIGADFIGFLVLIIYVGAISVLFLFIVMMVHFYTSLKEFSITILIISLLTISCLHFVIMELLSFYFVIKSDFSANFLNFNNLKTEHFVYESLVRLDTFNYFFIKSLNFNILEEISYFLNSFFTIIFLFCGIILFLGILGVILVVKLFFENKRKQQSLSEQILKSFHKSLLKIKS